MEISQKVRAKLTEAIQLWADQTPIGKPAILGNAVFFNIVRVLQNKTDEIDAIFNGYRLNGRTIRRKIID